MTKAKLVKPTISRNNKVVTPTAPIVLSLLSDLVSAYTVHHKNLEVQGTPFSSGISFSIRGHEDDQGRLVGAQGVNILALQTLLKRIGRKMQQRVQLSLLDPIVGVEGPIRKFQSNPDFKHQATTALLKRTLSMTMAFPYQLSIAPDVAGSTEYELRPDDAELAIVRGEFAIALQHIFHAIGMTCGRIINVHLADPNPPDDALPPMTIVAMAPTRRLNPVEQQREDDLEAEAAERLR